VLTRERLGAIRVCFLVAPEPFIHGTLCRVKEDQNSQFLRSERIYKLYGHPNVETLRLQGSSLRPDK
jgi:hypothetical protein